MRWAWYVAAALAALTGCNESMGPNLAPQDEAAAVQPELLVYTNLTFAQISAGGAYSCGGTTSGKLYCWGYNYYSQLGNGTLNNKKRPTAVNSALKFTWVSAGPNHTCAIATDSKAYCWGNNSYGQLGDGTNINKLSPKLVAGGLS